MPESMSFSLTQLNISLLIPMSISLLGGIVLLGVGVFNKIKSRDLYIAISLLFVIVNLGFLVLEANPLLAPGFFGLLLVDGISLLAQMIMLITTLIILLFFMRQNSFAETQNAEFYALLLFALVGFSFMVSSQNLILILLGLETASLSIYALIALHNKQVSFESSIKYFVMGALATAFYAFGAMLLYATTGSVNLVNVAKFLLEHNYEPSILVFAGFTFLVAAFGFKISMVPFHTWVPDVYEGSNSLLAAFIAIVPKIAAFSVIISVFNIFLKSHNTFVEYTLYTLIILSITLPNLIALVQKDVKRMLAYSSISHSGFVLAAIFVGTQQALEVVFLYWILFLFANVGAFGILWLSADSKYNHSFKSFSGMIKTNPTLAIFLSLFMFALAGIPPFSVFWGKMYLILEVLSADYIFLALAMVINSTIAGFYYLKLVVYIFAKDSNGIGDYQPPLELSSKVAIGICAIMSVGCIFMVQNLLDIISYYLKIY
nr:NADH-quinone oxidoreductase subunit NuoN [uncultured Helicobacter sp.]